jgi:hypothetical protein
MRDRQQAARAAPMPDRDRLHHALVVRLHQVLGVHRQGRPDPSPMPTMYPRPAANLCGRLALARASRASSHHGGPPPIPRTRVRVQELGDGSRPYLRGWYEGLRHYPGFDTTGMTSAAETDVAVEASVQDMECAFDTIDHEKNEQHHENPAQPTGLDPEILAIGVELAAFHIVAGAQSPIAQGTPVAQIELVRAYVEKHYQITILVLSENSV